MIKNKEWLKEELKKEIEKPIYFHSAVTSERQIVYREMLRLVSQLEEPEITEEQAWNKIKLENHYHIAPADVEVYQEAIVNGVKPSEFRKEKVVIPQFVADWFEGVKDGNIFTVATGVNDFIFEFAQQYYEGSIPFELKDWYLANSKTFYLACLYGYEVEKEPLYYLEFPNDHFKDVCLAIDYNGAKCLHSKAYSKAMDYKNTFTETELLGIDETGFIRGKVTE